MRLRNLILLPIIALLSGCTNSIDEEKITIMCPTGAPSVALSIFTGENFDTTSDPSLLKSYMAAETYSVVVAPTDVGVKAIQEGCKYRLSATITFGNFFLVSTGHDTDSNIDEDDSIVLFQQNALPDKIFHYVYGNKFDNSITYVKNVQVAANAYQSQEVTTEDGAKIPADYVLLSEPKVSALKIEESKITDLSKKFKDKSGTQIYQASIFIQNDVNSEDFLNSVSESIISMKSNKQAVIDNMNKASDPQTFFGITPELAATCMEKGTLGVDFKKAKDSVEEIKKYLSILGMENINENIFDK